MSTQAKNLKTPFSVLHNVQSIRRGQRMRHEWRIGAPVLFQHYLIASAETVTALLHAEMNKESQKLQLVVTGERARFLGIDQNSPVALDVAGLALEDIFQAIDPTRVAQCNRWQNAKVEPVLPERQIYDLTRQIKRTGLLPSLIVAELNAEQLLYWQVQDLIQLQEKDLNGPLPIALTQLPCARVPLQDAGNARIMTFRDDEMGHEHLAILIGEPGATPLVRMHSSCLTGDALASLRCDCGPQLQQAIARMKKEGGGILLYLNQEGRGIGFGNKMRAYRLQDAGLDTMDANCALGFQEDERSFEIAAQILRALHVPSVRLLTNNPDKVGQLGQYGIQVAERLPHHFGANKHNKDYLKTKKSKGGHLF